jgi:hypothetical protein
MTTAPAPLPVPTVVFGGIAAGMRAPSPHQIR